MNLDRFAIIIADQCLVNEFGDKFVGRIGICRVTDGVSETQIVPSYMLDELLDGFAVTPKRAPYPSVLIPFHAELEGIRLIRQEALKLSQIESSGLPDFFHRINAMESGSFAMKLSEAEVSFYLAASLVQRLGLRDGDRMSFAGSNDGSEFCLYYDKQGNDLSLNEPEGEELRVTFYMSASHFSVTGNVEDFSTQPIHLPFEIREQRIHFLKSDVLRNILFMSGEQTAKLANATVVDAFPSFPRENEAVHQGLSGRFSLAVGDWALYFPFG
jgi:hypothetical protein